MAPLSVTADASGSTSPSGSLASIVIDWGDGTVSSADTTTITSAPCQAVHSYSSPGTFDVTSTVLDVANLQSSTSETVNVSAAPVAASAVLSLLTNGMYVYSPVRIQGALTASGGATFTHVRIYVDGNILFDQPEAAGTYTLDKYVPVSGGAWHTIYIEGVDTNGNTVDSNTATVFCVGLASS